MKRITRDDTEHGVEYYRADEVDSLLTEQPAQPQQEPTIAACINGADSVGNKIDGYEAAKVYAAMQKAMRFETSAPQPAQQEPDWKDLLIAQHEETILWQAKRIAELLDAPQPPAQQEPVAWMHVMDNTEGIKANGKGHISITQKRKHPFGKPGVDFSKSYPVISTPLYTSPPAQRTWVGLTDEKIIKIFNAICNGKPFGIERILELHKAIEAKLKEKNT